MHKFPVLRNDASLIERMLLRTNKTRTCWLWLGSQNGWGYGDFTYKGKTEAVHRRSFKHFNGAIPKDRMIDHICHVRNCWNPKHLMLATAAENFRNSSLTNAGKKVCPKCLGKYSFVIYQKKNRVHRFCRKCRNEQAKKWYHAGGKVNVLAGQRRRNKNKLEGKQNV